MYLGNATTWHMDGNFSMAPTIFKQLYVIRAPLDASAVSCVYALLPGKTEALYMEILNAVVNRCRHFGRNPLPTSVVMDFEKGTINAGRGTFNHILLNITGCYFHLSANMWKKIQKYGITVLYNQNNDVKLFIGMILGLSFLPTNEVINGFNLLLGHIPDQALNPVINYFANTYIFGRPQQQLHNNGQIIRAPPRFPPPTWNYMEITIAGGSRTNNICEGWNNAFTRLVGEYHPPLFKLVNQLQKDESLARINIIQSQNGIPLLQRRRPEYMRLQTRLRNLCVQYDNGQWNDYMLAYSQAVGHTIKF